MSSNSSMFVLTIGIDTYLRAISVINDDTSDSRRVEKHSSRPIFKNLSGCVADADDIVAFFTDKHFQGVPPENIINLRNEQATAAGIVAAFDTLTTDSRIPKGANIFIFYAGHSTEALPPEGWPSNGMIQMLVPYDFEPGSGPNPIARNGLIDIEIGKLLEKLANEKGNNITVVFDCCHSGSGTRGFGRMDETVSFTARCVELLAGTRLASNSLPASRAGGSMVPVNHRHMGLGSHVLLAACTELQHAYEVDGRGLFTSALAKLLRSENLQQLTYSDIIRKLPKLDRRQDPQCEGINKDRTFLHNRAAPPRPTLYNFIENEAGEYEIDAGEAHGVTPPAEFTVYDTDECINVLGHFVVYRIEPFKSLLRPSDGSQYYHMPGICAFALQTRIGTSQDNRTYCGLRLLVERDRKLEGDFRSLCKRLNTAYPYKPSFKVVGTREEYPDLVVTASGGAAHFEITDRVCRDAGMYELYHRAGLDSESLADVLPGITDFYWNLRRPRIAPGFRRLRVGVECYELEFGAYDSVDAMKPIGPNLCRRNTIQIEISSVKKPYGFCLRNMTEFPLFVSAFYFNMCDLSVTSYYQPSSAGQDGHLASIAPGYSNFLTIGYGPSGSQAHTFYLNKGQDVAVGYLKIFTSTEYVNYSQVTQDSPFLLKGRGTSTYDPSESLHRWSAQCTPIILRRVGTH